MHPRKTLFLVMDLASQLVSFLQNGKCRVEVTHNGFRAPLQGGLQATFAWFGERASDISLQGGLAHPSALRFFCTLQLRDGFLSGHCNYPILTSPRPEAIAMASIRLNALSFFKIALTWFFTVYLLM